MKVVFYIKGFRAEIMDALPTMYPQDAFDTIRKQNNRPAAGSAKMKIGRGTIADEVQFNLMHKHTIPASFRLEPRKGYTQATFEFL